MAVQVPISNTFISSELFSPDEPGRLTATLGPCTQIVTHAPPGGFKWGDHCTAGKGLSQFDYSLAVTDQWNKRTATNYGSYIQSNYYERQPYRLTKLLKSYCRHNDQQLKPCMKAEIKPMRVLSSVDPYWSHKPIFEVFPTADPKEMSNLTPETREVLCESVKDRQRSTYMKSYQPHPIDAILKAKTEIYYPGLGQALIDVTKKYPVKKQEVEPPKPVCEIPESTAAEPQSGSVSWPPKAYLYEKHFQVKENVDRFGASESDTTTKEDQKETKPKEVEKEECPEEFQSGSICDSSNLIRRLCPCEICHQFRKRLLKRQEDYLRNRNYYKEISDFQQSVAKLDSHGTRPPAYQGVASLRELFAEVNRGKEYCTDSIRKMQTNVRAFQRQPQPLEYLGSLPSGLPSLAPMVRRGGPVKYGLRYKADMVNNHRYVHRDHIPDLRRNHVFRKRYVFDDYHAQVLRGNCRK